MRLLRTRLAAFFHDITMVPLAWLSAYWLRFNLETIPDVFLQPALQLLPLVILVQGVMFWHFGLYRGVWRYASLPDLVRIGKSIAIAVVILAALIYYFTHIPRSVLPIYSVLLLIFLGGPRLIYRWLKDYKFTDSLKKRALVIGAGDAGEQLVRELFRLHQGDYLPVGFIDDNPRKHGREIHGLRVLGGTSEVTEIVSKHDIDLMILAIPSATPAQMRSVVEACEVTDLPFITLPKTADLISGKITLSDLREVSIEDLLGREPVSLDWDAINAGIKDRVVMVTGGGGSIGSELCRQVARIGPSQLTVVDHSEFNLYSIEQELLRNFPTLDLEIRLIDVSEEASIHRAMQHVKPDVVFHAAAYKHVPMLETHLREAASNNILGTRNTIEAAVANKVGNFVLISTDKAVNPTNIMGTTKRISEILCQRLAEESDTKFIVVRFGNVLNSAGSVVPIFRQQIEQGGPVTVTHADITRYFMTIPEACQLILQAEVIGEGGEIYVLDMGEPVKIHYLAEQMIKLSGKEVGTEIEIQFTGLRPGEKLYEELFHTDEDLAPTKHEKIRLAQTRDVSGLNIEKALTDLETACQTYKEDEILAIIRELVPEYTNS